jgi:hypothetical protein
MHPTTLASVMHLFGSRIKVSKSQEKHFKSCKNSAIPHFPRRSHERTAPSCIGSGRTRIAPVQVWRHSNAFLCNPPGLGISWKPVVWRSRSRGNRAGGIAGGTRRLGKRFPRTSTGGTPGRHAWLHEPCQNRGDQRHYGLLVGHELCAAEGVHELRDESRDSSWMNVTVNCGTRLSVWRKSCATSRLRSG